MKLWLHRLREGVRHRGLGRVMGAGLVCRQLRLELWAPGWQVGGIRKEWTGYVSGSCPRQAEKGLESEGYIL